MPLYMFGMEACIVPREQLKISHYTFGLKYSDKHPVEYFTGLKIFYNWDYRLTAAVNVYHCFFTSLRFTVTFYCF